MGCSRIVAGAVALLASVAAADPYVGYVYPPAVRVGTTNALVVCGQAIGDVKGIHAGDGVKCLGIEVVPGFTPPTGDQRKYLVKWLDAIADGRRERPPLPDVPHVDEWHSNRWWSVLGDLGPLELSLVEHWLYTPRNPLQMSPSLRQKAIVRVAVDADAAPGVREFRVYGANGMSAPKPLVVTAARCEREPLYEPPHRRRTKAPVVGELPCFACGQVEPGQTDVFRVELKAGRPVTFRLFGREFEPYIGDAVPGFFNPEMRLLAPDGREVAIARDYHYHPDPVLVHMPEEGGTYSLEIRDTLYRGREDFVYAVEVSAGLNAPAAADLFLSPPPDWSVPDSAKVAEFAGTVYPAGAAMSHRFSAAEPGEYVFDLLARRAGSPLDGRVSVYAADGTNALARFSDSTNAVHRGAVIQGECDPVGRLRIDAPGEFRVEVEDEERMGGTDYSYVLRISRPAPRFEVWANRSSFAPRKGAWRSFKVYAIRHDGFEGEIRLEADPCVRLGRRLIPASSNVVTTSLVAQSPAGEPQTFGMTAWAKVGGKKVTVPVVPADEYNQAFAWDHLLPARSFVFKSWGPPPKKPQPPKKQPAKGRPPPKKQPKEKR